MTVHKEIIHPLIVAGNRQRVAGRETGRVRRVAEISAPSTPVGIQNRIVLRVRHQLSGPLRRLAVVTAPASAKPMHAEGLATSLSL